MQSCYYNCSREYVDSIDPNLHDEISGIITDLPKKKTRAAFSLRAPVDRLQPSSRIFPLIHG